MSENKVYPIDRFLRELQGYVDHKERGPLADLRRGLSETTEHRAWPYLAAWCYLTNDTDRAIWRTIGAGFATLQTSEASGNMGDTMHWLAIGDRRKKSERLDALTSFDGRFRRLLTCRTAEEVCRHLPGIIRAAKNKDVGVNFRQLYWDLVNWEKEKPDVKVQWASAYWGVEGGRE